MRSISKEEFLERFKKKFPEEDIEILEYSAVSRPIKVKCRWCGKKHYYGTGDQLLASFRCCQQQRKEIQEKVKKLYENNAEFQLIKWVDQTHIILYHNKCGNQIRKSVESCLKAPYRCKFCDMADQFAANIAEEAAAQLKKRFHSSISLLEFNKEGKSKYQCNKCGAIFEAIHAALMLSRGCPRCKQ